MVDGDVFRMSEAADAAELPRRAATTAKKHAADASAAEQEALVAAA